MSPFVDIVREFLDVPDPAAQSGQNQMGPLSQWRRFEVPPGGASAGSATAGGAKCTAGELETAPLPGPTGISRTQWAKWV